MAYIGRQNLGGAYRQLDDISSSFNGSTTAFTMQVSSTNVSLGDVNQIILSLGGVIQKPGTDFTVSGSTLTFTTAPAANTSFFAILLGSDNGGTVTPTDGSVTTSKIVDDAVTAAKVASSGAFAIGAAGTASSLAGIPFYNGDTTSIYTHDVSGTDSTAQNNTAYGIAALDAITTGDDNVAIGYNAGTAMTSASFSTVVGRNAGASMVDSRLTAIGYYAGAATTHIGNTFVGFNTGSANTSGTENTAMGYNAYYQPDTENYNTAIGYGALGGPIAGGEYNIAVGGNCLDALTSGDHNICLGYNAASAITTMGQTICIGSSAGTNLTTGAHAQNIMIGYATGYSLTSETHNLYIGRVADGTGTPNGCEYNVGVGNYVFQDLTTGDYNTVVGYTAGRNITTGANNTAIGIEAGGDVTTGGNNTHIGGEAGRTNSPHNTTNESNRVVIGNNSVSDFYAKVSLTVTSDARDKMNFEDVSHGLDFVNQLKPVKFHFKKSRDDETPHGKARYGFKAQDILALEGDNPVIIDNENIESLKYKGEHLVPVLVKALQELSTKVKALEEA